jgi:hypothetical protein
LAVGKSLCLWLDLRASRDSIGALWKRSRWYRVLMIATAICAVIRLSIAVVTALLVDPADHMVLADASLHLWQRQALYIGQDQTITPDLLMYNYSPVFAFLFTPFALVPRWLGFGLLFVLHLVAYIVIYLVWGRMLRRIDARAGELLLWSLPLWIAYSPFWADLGLGNIYVFMACAATLLLDAILDGRLGCAVLWLSLILPAKPQWTFAALIPLLLGERRFFARLVAYALLAYGILAGVMVVVLGPEYIWAQHVAFVQHLTSIGGRLPWLANAPYLGYNHSVTSVMTYVLGLNETTLRLSVVVRLVLLLPLVRVILLQLLRPVRRDVRDADRLSVAFFLALYMGTWVWLDMVGEIALGVAVFVYLAQRTTARRLILAVFLPYVFVDIWRLATLGVDMVAGVGLVDMERMVFYADPMYYAPVLLCIILVFYALLVSDINKSLAVRPAPVSGDETA